MNDKPTQAEIRVYINSISQWEMIKRKQRPSLFHPLIGRVIKDSGV